MFNNEEPTQHQTFIQTTRRVPTSVDRINNAILFKKPHTLSTENKTKKVFKLKDEFYTLLSTLPKFKTQQKYFSYNEITQYVTQYIIHNKENILDCNNISIAHVENDPIGKLFNVKQFKKKQLHELIQQHIKYKDNV